MKKALLLILHMDQKGFVPKRSLDDAVLKIKLLMDYCKRTNLTNYLLFLDQEKAFDRVDRDMMHKIIAKFDFPPRIRNMIKAIYRSTPAKININGSLTRPITLISGVRQGCPLSPSLFALCIETLSNMIRSHPTLCGIHVPGVGSFKISTFADDTTIVIPTNIYPDNRYLNTVLELLNIYENGTGAKANVSKTELFPIGPNTHNPIDISHPDILRLPYNAQVRFLGVYLTNTELDDNIWNERLTKLKNNL